MGYEEEAASDLEPRTEADTAQFRQAARMPSILDGLDRDKLDDPYKGAQLPEPHVMHRNPAGERERRCQKLPRKGKAAADIPVPEHIPPETGPHVEQSEDGIVRNPFDLVDDVAVERYQVWPGRRPGKLLPDHLYLVIEPDVVLIGKHDDISPRLAQGVFTVEGRAEEGIAGKQPNARVGKGPDDLERTVGGGIVGDHHLIVRGQLGEDRLHLAPDEALAVVRRHADRDAVMRQWSIVDSFKP
jgi:hypothetical protein